MRIQDLKIFDGFMACHKWKIPQSGGKICTTQKFVHMTACPYTEAVMLSLNSSKTNECKDGKENLGWVRDTLNSYVSTECLPQRVRKTFCQNVRVKSVPEPAQVFLTILMLSLLALQALISGKSSAMISGIQGRCLAQNWSQTYSGWR